MFLHLLGIILYWWFAMSSYMLPKYTCCRQIQIFLRYHCYQGALVVHVILWCFGLIFSINPVAVYNIMLKSTIIVIPLINKCTS